MEIHYKFIPVHLQDNHKTLLVQKKVNAPYNISKNRFVKMLNHSFGAEFRMLQIIE